MDMVIVFSISEAIQVSLFIVSFKYDLPLRSNDANGNITNDRNKTQHARTRPSRHCHDGG